jgi:hypothetical protein
MPLQDCSICEKRTTPFAVAVVLGYLVLPEAQKRIETGLTIRTDDSAEELMIGFDSSITTHSLV